MHRENKRKNTQTENLEISYFTLLLISTQAQLRMKGFSINVPRPTAAVRVNLCLANLARKTRSPRAPRSRCASTIGFRTLILSKFFHTMYIWSITHIIAWWHYLLNAKQRRVQLYCLMDGCTFLRLPYLTYKTTSVTTFYVIVVDERLVLRIVVERKRHAFLHNKNQLKIRGFPMNWS